MKVRKALKKTKWVDRLELFIDIYLQQLNQPHFIIVSNIICPLLGDIISSFKKFQVGKGTKGQFLTRWWIFQIGVHVMYNERTQNLS